MGEGTYGCVSARRYPCACAEAASDWFAAMAAATAASNAVPLGGGEPGAPLPGRAASGSDCVGRTPPWLPPRLLKVRRWLRRRRERAGTMLLPPRFMLRLSREAVPVMARPHGLGSVREKGSSCACFSWKCSERWLRPRPCTLWVPTWAGAGARGQLSRPHACTPAHAWQPDPTTTTAAAAATATATPVTPPRT